MSTKNTVLIVDDEASLRNALVFDFKRRGFTVLDAENGTQALEIVEKNKLDLVLTDIRMPNGNGVELLDAIKARNPDLPIVMFITGFADLTLEDAYDKGADAVFAKPFDRKLLLETVSKVLTAREERWSKRISERVPTDFEIALEFPELKLAIEGRVLNIGRGGMFVSLRGPFPTVGAKVVLKGLIGGNGVVRWVRTEQAGECSTGCGIEFEYLDDESRQRVVNWIDTTRFKSFIPKT